jgi:hypothetical protein
MKNRNISLIFYCNFIINSISSITSIFLSIFHLFFISEAVIFNIFHPFFYFFCILDSFLYFFCFFWFHLYFFLLLIHIYFISKLNMFRSCFFFNLITILSPFHACDFLVLSLTNIIDSFFSIIFIPFMYHFCS